MRENSAANGIVDGLDWVNSVDKKPGGRIWESQIKAMKKQQIPRKSSSE